ncbi:MAG: hypothetical protein HY260_23330, partial [Chloroflexi bacterium]|nr:hypothetical protein [Chloroflexota bacterium]
MTSTPFKRRWAVLMLAITLLGFGLRAHDLGAKSFWYDELRQIEVARLPLSEWSGALLAHAARPLDYLITRVILTFTRSEWILRFPALAWGTLTLPLVYRIGRRSLGPRE